MMLLLAILLPVVVAAALMYMTYRFGLAEGRSEIPDRDALARAAHKHFCVVPNEPTHEPDDIDYDKADEVIEILWCLERAS